MQGYEGGDQRTVLRSHLSPVTPWDAETELRSWTAQETTCYFIHSVSSCTDRGAFTELLSAADLAWRDGFLAGTVAQVVESRRPQLPDLAQYRDGVVELSCDPKT